MKRFLFLSVTIILFASCKFDTPEKMNEKCRNLLGINELILNETTLKDVYSRYNKENVIECVGYRPNIKSPHNDAYSEIHKDAYWTALTINEFDKNFSHGEVDLDFYLDTLVQITYRYEDYYIEKKLPEYFFNKYGKGVPVSIDYLDSLNVGDSNMQLFSGSRMYMNNDIHMIVDEKFGDIIIFHKPKFVALVESIKCTYKSYYGSISTKKETTSRPRGHNSMDADDLEYWDSVNREQALKDAGLYEAAKIERKARLEYLRGGGYKSQDGGSQVHYQGSKEQKEHLDEMDRRGW